NIVALVKRINNGFLVRLKHHLAGFLVFHNPCCHGQPLNCLYSTGTPKVSAHSMPFSIPREMPKSVYTTDLEATRYQCNPAIIPLSRSSGSLSSSTCV